MDDLFNKYKQLILENEELKIKLQRQTTQTNLLETELACLKSNNYNTENIDPNKKSTKSNETEDKFKSHLARINKYVCGLLGYRLTVTPDDKVELLSKYAFDENDKFVFVDENDSIDMLSNDFTDEYSKEIEEYIVKGNSVPAFVAAVTLDLWSKKTFQ